MLKLAGMPKCWWAVTMWLRQFAKYQIWFKAAGTALVLAAVFLIAEAAPPTTLRIAAGPASGGYYELAQELSSFLAEHGVELQVVETEGSVENIQHLRRTVDQPVDLAIIQGGTTGSAPQLNAGLTTLATVDLEPVLIVTTRRDIRSLADLEDTWINIGHVGSGTEALFQDLTRNTGVMEPTRTFRLQHAAAVRDLLDGRIDAMFVVTPISTTWLSDLFERGDVNVANIREAEALPRHFPFLTLIDIPRAGLNLKRGIPEQNTRLLATSTSIATRRDLHPAIKVLVLEGLSKMMHGSRKLSTAGQFPSLLHAPLPPDSDARAFFANGPSVIRNYLPFWLANLLDRFLLLVLPALPILLALWRYLPRLLSAEKARHVAEAYEKLRQIEANSNRQDVQPEELLGSISDLEAFDRWLKTGAPKFDEASCFQLRVHAELASRDLWRRFLDLAHDDVETLLQGRIALLTPQVRDELQQVALTMEEEIRALDDLLGRFEATGAPEEAYADLRMARRKVQNIRERLHGELATTLESAVPSTMLSGTAGRGSGSVT